MQLLEKPQEISIDRTGKGSPRPSQKNANPWTQSIPTQSWSAQHRVFLSEYFWSAQPRSGVPRLDEHPQNPAVPNPKRADAADQRIPGAPRIAQPQSIPRKKIPRLPSPKRIPKRSPWSATQSIPNPWTAPWSEETRCPTAEHPQWIP